ncbi:MAG: hypothetical protein Q7K57_59275 [Burkholderiaceae bacterium]|nr:hypothetical protein [Burkholderiaceae bacterium]
MNTSPTVWLPAGQNLTEEQREALAVPAWVKPNRNMYSEMLARSLQEKINADPKEARCAMEMLLDQVASQNNREHWGTAIVGSDNLMMVLNQIDWRLPGQIQQKQEQNLAQMLEVLV